MGKTITKTDAKKQESYLKSHPWFSEPFEAAMHLSEDMPDLVLKPNFSREYPTAVSDFFENCPSHRDCYIPHTYFDFISLIGGFDCGSVRLYTEGFEAFSVSQEANEGGPLKILLGECDHGQYIFNPENDSYYLEGYNRTTPFVNCVAMLLHAIYRAHVNVGLN